MKERKIPYKLTVRAFSSMIVKILAFSISKIYFIHFNISLYNTPNIKGSIILPLHLNILFLFFLYVSFILSLCFQITTINYHDFCTQQQPSHLSPSPTFSSSQHQQMIHLMHTCSMQENNLIT